MRTKMANIGVYMMIDKNTLADIMKLEGDKFVEKLDELEETSNIYTIDKLWDGLHFLLTGVSASTPVEGDRLSEAIVGIHVFKANDDYFIACIENDELPEIIEALENVNIQELEKKFDPNLFKKKKIYPYMHIREIDKHGGMFKELISEYNGLLSFYKKALEKNAYIIFSVF
jgi:hypothetical protein